MINNSINKFQKVIIYGSKLLILIFILTGYTNKATDSKLSQPKKINIFKKPEEFVYLSDIDPTIHQDIRYATNNNFIGRPIKGYKKSVCILTKKAALALAKVQKELKKKYGKSYSLKVYDAYRPQTSVNDFWEWAHNSKDLKMKKIFYPDIENKKDLFKKGYIAKKSGHTRGSTVDLTIIIEDSTDSKEIKNYFNQKDFTDNSIEMGTIFDLFDKKSHYANENISKEAKKNRKILRELMVKHGFIPYESEWWHFTLKNEPFPNTYFDFPII